MAVRKMSNEENIYFRENMVAKTRNKLLKKYGQNQDWNRLKIMIFSGDLQKSYHMQTKTYAET